MNVETSRAEDGTVRVTIIGSDAEMKDMLEGLPPLVAGAKAGDEAASSADALASSTLTNVDIGGAQPLGFWPKAKHYCVKVTKGNSVACQVTIYESPLWAWARAVGIAVRMGGGANMSSGRCQGDQDSCGVS
jgi:hypothetical protein